MWVRHCARHSDHVSSMFGAEEDDFLVKVDISKKSWAKNQVPQAEEGYPSTDGLLLPVLKPAVRRNASCMKPMLESKLQRCLTENLWIAHLCGFEQWPQTLIASDWGATVPPNEPWWWSRSQHGQRSTLVLSENLRFCFAGTMLNNNDLHSTFTSACFKWTVATWLFRKQVMTLKLRLDTSTQLRPCTHKRAQPWDQKLMTLAADRWRVIRNKSATQKLHLLAGSHTRGKV